MNCFIFYAYEHLKFHAQLSLAFNFFITSEPVFLSDVLGVQIYISTPGIFSLKQLK